MPGSATLSDASASTDVGGVAARLRAYFEFTERGATFPREVVAGFSTFFALSYIFVVNPAVLAQAGIPKSAVFFATVGASAAATLAMGLWARLPFAVAPGLEMNAYIAFVVVGSLGFAWQEALGLCFWSGVVMVLVTVSRLRERFITGIPNAMRISLAAMVGIFVGLIALQLAGIVAYEDERLSHVGLALNTQLAILVVGLAALALLFLAKVRGAVLGSIVIAAVAAHLFGVPNASGSAHLSGEMFSGAGALVLNILADPRSVTVVVVLFMLDFYGSAAKFIGLSVNTKIMSGGRVPRLTEALSVDGAGSALGAALGTSTLTTFVESSAGIREGGRTGITAVVCGLLMLAVLPFVSALSYIPVIATAGALMFVAITLFPDPSDLRIMTRTDRLALGAMLLVVIATFALALAILAAFVIYIAAAVWNRTKPNLAMLVSVALIGTGIVLQNG